LEERISKLPLGKGNKLKEGHGNFSREKGHLGGVCVFFLGKKKEKKKECVISSYVWKVLFMKEMCVRIKHGKISMTKPLEFYFK
jgi:hypothetical protein